MWEFHFQTTISERAFDTLAGALDTLVETCNPQRLQEVLLLFMPPVPREYRELCWSVRSFSTSRTGTIGFDGKLYFENVSIPQKTFQGQ